MPVTAGLSLSNYYERPVGENDAFGFASMRIKASVPLPVDRSWGAWTVSAGVQGDAASSFNNGSNGEVIATLGASLSF